MAPSLRTVCLAAGLAALAAAPAAAQFNPFEALFGSPPRPPGSVPGGRQQGPPQQGYQYPDQRYHEQRYPDQRYPDQRYPEQPYPEQGQTRGLPGGIQGQPLPPPPGGTAAAVEPRSLLPGQRQPLGAPQPADTSPQPDDEVITEPPAQKIANKGALFAGLDKITGRIIKFDVEIGETVQFGALQVTPRICYSRPPTESPNTNAFIEVEEVTLQGEVKRIFTGWMFASSPGLHAVEHSIYDVWLTDCKNPVIAATAPVEPAAAPPPKPAAPARRPTQQTAPRR